MSAGGKAMIEARGVTRVYTLGAIDVVALRRGDSHVIER